MRAFSALCFLNLTVGVFLAIPLKTVVAQTLPTQGGAIAPPPAPPPVDFVPLGASNGVSPQFSRYLLGPGDAVGVQVSTPSGTLPPRTWGWY